MGADGPKSLPHNLWVAVVVAALSISPIGRVLAQNTIASIYMAPHVALADFTAFAPGPPAVVWHILVPAYPVLWCVGGLLLTTMLRRVAVAGLT